MSGIRPIKPENKVSQVHMCLSSQQVNKVLLLTPELLVAVMQQGMQLIQHVLWHPSEVLVLVCGAPLRQALSVLDQICPTLQLSSSCCNLP